MQLPVDAKKLLTEVTNLSQVGNAPLSVSVYVEDDAPADLAAHVRGAFSSSSPTLRIALSYIADDFHPHPTDDVAILVCGTAKDGQTSSQIDTAAHAEEIRSVGVPVMVVTDSKAALEHKVALLGKEIPDGDIVAPDNPSGEEPVVLDEASLASLDERMGRWVVTVCRGKRLAFAVAFPFMRRSLAQDAVLTTAIENAGVGLVPFVGGADLPIMTLNQAKMALQIAAAYGQGFNKNRLKELAFVLVGAYFSRAIARRLVAFIPVIGFVFRSGVAYGTTTAVGYTIIEYFEGGQDITGVANVLERGVTKGAKIASAAQAKLAKFRAK